MNTAFEQTCNRYLAEIADIDFRRMEVELGIAARKDGAVIPLLGTDYLMECLAMVGMLLADRLKQMLLHKQRGLGVQLSGFGRERRTPLQGWRIAKIMTPAQRDFLNLNPET